MEEQGADPNKSFIEQISQRYKHLKELTNSIGVAIPTDMENTINQLSVDSITGMPLTLGRARSRNFSNSFSTNKGQHFVEDSSVNIIGGVYFNTEVQNPEKQKFIRRKTLNLSCPDFDSKIEQMHHRIVATEISLEMKHRETKELRQSMKQLEEKLEMLRSSEKACCYKCIII